MFLSYMMFSAHYNDVIMIAMASQITTLAIVYSIVYSGADQRKHQRYASLAFVRGIYRWPVNSPHKWPVTWKMFPFDYVIMARGPRLLIGGAPKEQQHAISSDHIRCCTTQEVYDHLRLAVTVCTWWNEWQERGRMIICGRPFLSTTGLSYGHDFYQREFDDWSLIAQM